MIKENKIIDYINSHWDECIKENRKDSGTLIGLPYPYTVPAVGFFDEIYYWDTYFTNKGLELCDRWDLVKNNTDNMLYLVDKYGFMLNGNRTYYLNNSQPPFLSMMVRDVYDHYKDKAWLTGAYEILCKEYDFWMKKRITPIGLNRYGGHWPDEELEEKVAGFVERLGFRPEAKTDREIADHYIITAESGLDVNPRWEFEGYNYAHIDLNALLYELEKNMAYFAKILGNNQENIWENRAGSRKELVIKYMDNNGVFYDYNFAEKRFGKIFSVAAFYPLFTKMADTLHAQKALENLHKLEAEYGIVYCEKNDAKGVYQWNYPMGWACMQYITVKALANYGFIDDAIRVAEKYLKLVEKVFDETGNLWEKYNVEKGNIEVAAEYDMPAMMGWTAGVYLALKKFLEEKII